MVTNLPDQSEAKGAIALTSFDIKPPGTQDAQEYFWIDPALGRIIKGYGKQERPATQPLSFVGDVTNFAGSLQLGAAR